MVSCTVDTCDEVGNTVLHTPDDLLCDDADECTADSCDEILGCAYDPIPGCPFTVPASDPRDRLILWAGLMASAGSLIFFKARRSNSGVPPALEQ